MEAYDNTNEIPSPPMPVKPPEREHLTYKDLRMGDVFGFASGNSAKYIKSGDGTACTVLKGYSVGGDSETYEPDRRVIRYPNAYICLETDSQEEYK